MSLESAGTKSSASGLGWLQLQGMFGAAENQSQFKTTPHGQ